MTDRHGKPAPGVRRSASDEPASGSVSAIVPDQRPVSMGGSQKAFCASVPNAASRFAAPAVSIG